MNRTKRFFESIKNKKIAFIGVGVSNTGVIKMFLEKGINVTVCDRKNQEAMGNTYDELKLLGAEFIL